MKRAEIFVDGDVQGVGYRYHVRRIARKHKLVGNVENLEDGRVRIICEGEEGNIGGFLQDISIREPPVFVETIEHKFSSPTGEFKTFKIITTTTKEEMIEGFSTGMIYLTTVGGEVKKVYGELKGFREESQNNFGILGEKIDQFREESNANFKELDEKYHSVSQELRSINQNIAKLAEGISKSNELLAKLIERYVLRKRRRGK